MKLWVKLAAASTAIIIIVLALSLIAVNIMQEAALKRMDEENVRMSLSLLCRNVTSAMDTDTSRVQPVTLRSIVHYYFSAYAHLLRRENVHYSLFQRGQSLFINSPVDLANVIYDTEIPELSSVVLGEAEIPVARLSDKEGDMLVGACSFTISDQTFTAYLSMDVSGTDKQILNMRWTSVFVLLIACICAALLLAFTIRFALRPVQKMTETAALIAGGEYSRRTSVYTRDEIGQLSKTFDQMADSIEDKISSLDEQLHRSQLLLGALAHELKTPMTSIIGYADSLLHMPLNEQQRIACAERILKAGKHTEALSQKLMELISLAEKEHIDKARFPAYHLANTHKETFGSEVIINCEPFELFGDKTLLLSMTVNLIENAIRVSPKGEKVNVDICRKGSIAYISVSDKGCGIPPAYIDLVTEPFFRVDKARSRRSGGAGLGLTICRLIAEHHGGNIAIESEPGKGTQITVSLLQVDDISSTT